MTFNAILFYYSRKGNTKALVNLFTGKCKIDKIDNIDRYDLRNYSTVVFATSTYGRGVPPLEFYKHKDVILNLSDKNIGLFGSGNSHYEFFCGALDVIEDMTKKNNNVLFKFKYEGYPKQQDIDDMKKIIGDIL